jgi:hypothetical protein
MIKWSIQRMERQIQSGLVFQVAWRVTASEGDISVCQGGQLDFVEGKTFTSFEELTEEEVLSWVKNKLGMTADGTGFTGVERMEKYIQDKLDKELNPPSSTTVSGLPW